MTTTPRPNGNENPAPTAGDEGVETVGGARLSATASPPAAKWAPWLRALRLILWLYVFMLSIKLMGTGFKALGTQFDLKGFLEAATDNPIVGVCIGLMVTAVVQSSSFTTSMLVTLVATESISLPNAIPMVMGANIGTTITSVFVATAHVARRAEFRLAFTAACVHDVFNFLAVFVLLPIEMLFQPLEHISAGLGGPIGRAFADSGGEIGKGPLSAVLSPVAHEIEAKLQLISSNETFIGVALLVLALAALFLALARMVVVLKQVFMGGVERMVNELLFKRWWTALLFGLVATALVQSSSMTVSLIVPMVASGLVTVPRAFPFTLGANIGTTVTAFLAAVVTASPVAISLALSHFMFNVAGTAIFLPLRRIPIGIAFWLADIVFRHRWFAIVYIVALYFVVPIAIAALVRLFV